MGTEGMHGALMHTSELRLPLADIRTIQGRINPDNTMKLLSETMIEVGVLYAEYGISINWFPFQVGGEVRYRIYFTDTRNWHIDNPMAGDEGQRSYLHFASLEEALESVIPRIHTYLEKQTRVSA